MPRHPPSLLFALLALCLIGPAGPATAGEMRAFDKNGDGRPDKWAWFEGEWPVEIRYDKNFDGQVDEWELLSNGRMRELREDRNYDGKADRIVAYDNGRPAFKKIDLDFDGNFDQLLFYDGTEDVRTASPELVRLLAERAGEGPSAAPSRPAALPAPPAAAPRPAPTPEQIAAASLPLFDLGEPGLRVPMLGGLDPQAEWRLERERSRFRGSLGGGEFELQHRPTDGALRIDRYPRATGEDGDAESLLEEGIARYAGALTRRHLASLSQERHFRTPFAPGVKRLYHVTANGRSERVGLYLLAGERDMVYLRASSSPEAFGRFEKLVDAMVFGLQVAPVPASLP